MRRDKKISSSSSTHMTSVELSSNTGAKIEIKYKILLVSGAVVDKKRYVDYLQKAVVGT